GEPVARCVVGRIANPSHEDEPNRPERENVCMPDLTRISISLESALLDAFDQRIESKGYATRSEAIRDLIRDRLLRDEAERAEGEQVAVVTLVYDHHARELAARLIDKQHHHHELVVSSLHVHLGERHCLEVSVLRGPSKA